jgi:RHS repeat-associated protein
MIGGYAMTAAGATTYQWDGANRLKSVNGGTSGSYGFDGNGKRVKKTEGGTSTYYVYSSVIGSAVMEVASAGVQRAYVMNGGSVVAQRNPNGQFYWLHADHLGSGRKMTDTSGNLTYRAEFDPYGKLLYEWSATPNLNTRKFTGYERDAGSGLDYAQARMYGSDWGRFLSPDPMGLASANKLSPKTLNRYSYVNGDPVNMVDPSGLFGGPPPPPFIKDGITITAQLNGSDYPNSFAPAGGYGVMIGEVMRLLYINQYQNQFMQALLYVALAAIPTLPRPSPSELNAKNNAQLFLENYQNCVDKINAALITKSPLSLKNIVDVVKGLNIIDINSQPEWKDRNVADYAVGFYNQIQSGTFHNLLNTNGKGVGSDNAQAYALTGEDGKIFFGSNFVTDGRTFNDQGRTIVHEALHVLFGHHDDIVNALGISHVAGNSDSAKLNQWLKGGCLL